MDKNERHIYLLSGPAGVGKSTTSKELVKKLSDSAYLSGDYISHMHINGREKPWKSKHEHSLIWDNILHLTRNFIDYGTDVVIDYVTFPNEARWLSENINQPNTVVKYVVLWVDKNTLTQRDNMRKEEDRMGERCFILFDEFSESGLDKKHFLNTSELTIKENDFVIDTILNDRRFCING
ncbi:AAA family ATPase [Bacillus sp. Marseille-Q3570]|uniref:AAA family ATPase n=1 Tax=Bacillus sp. Marseille-Q3570 TaxID=2963522 RepID=UPI0021B7BC7B|nr:AAA family ATPase [Bacillus sp. Marseille-Q3570]